MEQDFSDYRKTYEKKKLSIAEVPKNPRDLFDEWFREADQDEQIKEANAMTLSTVGLDGFPKSRIVLLKKITDDGFVFFTNYESEKGKAIAENNNVCMSFFWESLERQVIIKGTVEKLSDAESENYFQSRPKGSQLGALVSKQSTIIPSRAVLSERLEELELKYKNQKIERPNFWGGYVVKPLQYEFWQGRPNRLHDRILYVPEKIHNWQIHRLSP